MMLPYFVQFLATTMAVVLLLVGVLWLIKRNPQLLAKLQSGQWLLRAAARPETLRVPSCYIEASMPLNARMQLAVVSVDGQRYLLAHGLERVQLIDKLHAIPESASELAPEAITTTTGGSPWPPLF